jgi:formylglycine-generating enzyme required for sulfatase activity
MAAERAKNNDFEASVKQGGSNFFTALRQEQFEKRWLEEAELDVGQFVVIPAGTYEIGSPQWELRRSSNENRHSIMLSQFSIMDAAVTQETYAKVMGINPSIFKGQEYCPQSFKEIDVKGVKIPVCADHPVEMVSWDDAIEFIQRLNALGTNHKYALPTEAQIEVAFRGGTYSAYVTGRNDQKAYWMIMSGILKIQEVKLIP